MLQHYLNLTIRLFSVISKTLIVGGILPLCIEEVSVFYSTSQLGKKYLDNMYKMFRVFFVQWI